MFDAQVRPILEYASEIWLSKTSEAEMEKLHLSFLKNTLKVKSSTSTVALYAELGRYPLKLKMQVQMLKYWQRILQLSPQHILRTAYNSNLDLHNMGQVNWCGPIHDLLKNIEMEHCWTDQSLSNRDICTIKEKLYSNHANYCMSSIGDSVANPKLRTYKQMKTEFRLEPYLCSSRNINHMLALVRFRISSHNLAIETGRYTRPKTPVENRLCLYCQAQETETESHFLLDCSLYIAERVDLISVLTRYDMNYYNLTLTEKFKTIMTCNEPDVIKALAKYVYTCLDKRSKAQLP